MGTPSKSTDKTPIRQHSPSPRIHPHSSNNKNNLHTTIPSTSPTPPPQPQSQTADRVGNSSSNNNNNNQSNNNTTDSTYQRPGPGFEHQVTNLPGGICHDTRNSLQQPQAYPQPLYSIYQHPLVYTIPAQMSTNTASVNSGVMPNGQAQHFQPQVPDTTNGPYQHTYYPRHDAQGSPVVMINGTPMVQVVGGHVPIQQAQGGIATAPIPMVVQGQQPPAAYIQGQPISYVAQPPAQAIPQPGMVPAMAYPQAGGSGPAMVVPGNGAPGAPFPPEIMGIGKTSSEVQVEQAIAAQSNQVLEPQDMKPADDDPSRMYYCRELDGAWIQRNRYSIDRMGDFRWYVWPNGIFYAVRLNN